MALTGISTKGLKRDCMLEARSLEVKLGSFTLGPMDLTIPPGLVTVVIGPNGSGKTTLLRALAGLLPHRGRVGLCGRRLSSLPGRGGLVEYVPSEPQADPYARVREIFEVSSADVDKAVSLIPELEGILERRLNELSSGEKKLVCIARGLSSGKPILLLDEPLSHLDVANQVRVSGLIRMVAREDRIVIVSSHELHMIGMLADRVILLDRGSLVFEVMMSSIEAQIPEIERVYGVQVEVLETARGIALLAGRLRAVTRGRRGEGKASKGLQRLPAGDHDTQEGTHR